MPSDFRIFKQYISTSGKFPPLRHHKMFFGLGIQRSRNQVHITKKRHAQTNRSRACTDTVFPTRTLFQKIFGNDDSQTLAYVFTFVLRAWGILDSHCLVVPYSQYSCSRTVDGKPMLGKFCPKTMIHIANNCTFKMTYETRTTTQHILCQMSVQALRV